MQYEAVHINREKMYSLGIDTETNTYLLEVVKGSVGLWMEYYQLTLDEFEQYPANMAEIDQLAEYCLRGKALDRKINR